MRRGLRSAGERLRDMLDAIENVRAAVGPMSVKEFSENWLVRLATERAIEIISEASRHIPDGLKEAEPDIPWRDIADMGNVLRHVYEKADPEIVWRVVAFDLPPLKAALRRLLKQAEAG